MPLKTINLSLNPFDYSAITYKRRKDVEALSGLTLRNHTLDEYGCPRVPNIGNFHKQNEMQSAITRIVSSIYSINGATQILLQSKRDQLNDQISSFGELGASEEDIHKKAAQKREEEKLYQDQASKSNYDEKEKTEIGAGLKDLTLEEKAIYDAGYKFMAEKRRAFAQAMRISPYINAFGFAGILMTGPRIYIPWILTSDDLGLKSPRKKDRLSSLNWLELEQQTIMSKFKMSTSQPEDNSSFLLFNIEDGIATISSIIDAMSQEDFGINDSDDEVRAKAIALETSAKEAEQILIAHKGMTKSCSVFLSN